MKVGRNLLLLTLTLGLFLRTTLSIPLANTDEENTDKIDEEESEDENADETG